MWCPDGRSLIPAQVAAGWLWHNSFRNPLVNTAADQKEEKDPLLQPQCGHMKDPWLPSILSTRIPAPTPRQVICKGMTYLVLC